MYFTIKVLELDTLGFSTSFLTLDDINFNSSLENLVQVSPFLGALPFHIQFESSSSESFPLCITPFRHSCLACHEWLMSVGPSIPVYIHTRALLPYSEHIAQVSNLLIYA